MVDFANVRVRNPREAAKALGGAGQMAQVPKQRNLFVVRFYPHGQQAGASQNTLRGMTFVAKSVDRPKVNPKSEELHQYNKKRQVYTGFKIEPVRMQFYDDYHSTALSMWQDYVTYHFGDFHFAASSPSNSYAYDVTSPQFRDINGTGFGFNGAPADGNGDFYFDRIEIYQFYHDLYDVYQLIHPRITAFDPDDLDYTSSEVSLISMTVAYENLQFALQRPVAMGDAIGQPFSEFQSGATFDGDVPAINTTATTPSAADGSAAQVSAADDIGQLLTVAQGPLSPPPVYRYNSAQVGGALTAFGNFQFGPLGIQFAAGGGQSLVQLSLNSPTLAAALDLGTSVDPLTVTQISVQAAVNTANFRGINGAQFDVALGQASAAFGPAGVPGFGASAGPSGFGNPTISPAGQVLNTVTNALLVSTAIRGNRPIATNIGVILTPQAYGAINVGQIGTAQYGYNPNTDASGESWGDTGSGGFAGPIGPLNDGPYSADLPNGLYGRYGINTEPLGVVGIPDNPVAPDA